MNRVLLENLAFIWLFLFASDDDDCVGSGAGRLDAVARRIVAFRRQITTATNTSQPPKDVNPQQQHIFTTTAALSAAAASARRDRYPPLIFSSPSAAATGGARLHPRRRQKRFTFTPKIIGIIVAICVLLALLLLWNCRGHCFNRRGGPPAGVGGAGIPLAGQAAPIPRASSAGGGDILAGLAAATAAAAAAAAPPDAAGPAADPAPPVIVSPIPLEGVGGGGGV